MQRITLWLLSTVAVLVLLFSYRTSTMGGAGGTDSSAAVAAAPPTTHQAGGTSSGDKTSYGDGTSGDGTASGRGTYDGSVVQTRWGPIQATITVSNGKITDVAVPIYPNGNHRDEEINAYALPTLRQETLDAQSADVDTVSGATVTSDGYKESLQAAIDAAHLS
jgi:uncharacterized protein with FMN-binding domain